MSKLEKTLQQELAKIQEYITNGRCQSYDDYVSKVASLRTIYMLSDKVKKTYMEYLSE